MKNQPTTTPEGQPEWLRVKEACDYSRLSKPKLYDLMNRGLLRYVALKEKDQRKGTRLIHHATLRTFLESRAVGGESTAFPRSFAGPSNVPDEGGKPTA